METYIVKKKDDKFFLFKTDQEVGQVSPEATWVKEGDEFKLTDFNPLSAANIEHNKPLTEPIRIKGQYGHYH